jgi:hypothetical protein
MEMTKTPETTTEFEGNGFRAKLPGIWLDESDPPSNELPEVHAYRRVDEIGAITVSRYELQPGAPRARIRELAEHLIASRKTKFMAMTPDARFGEEGRMREENGVFVGALEGAAANIVFRYQLRATEVSSIGIFYWEEGPLRAVAIVNTRWKAVREAFTFSQGE